MIACPLGFDADTIAKDLDRASRIEALLEHAQKCEACARTAHALELARRTWREGAEHDERFRRAASERRIAFGIPRTAAPWTSRVLPALAIAAAAGAVVWSARHAERSTVTPPAAQGDSAPVASSVAPAPPVTAAMSVRAPKGDRVLVAVRSCEGCGARHEGIAAGTLAVDGEPIEVPRGAVLSLNWGIDASLVDASSGIDVVGPARVRAAGVDDRAVLVVESGTARVRTAEEREVRTARVSTFGRDATWTVVADGDTSRISVERGAIDVRSAGGERPLTEGHALEVRAEARAPNAPAAPVDSSPPRAPSKPTDAAAASSLPPPPVSPEEQLRAATRALREGDRPRAMELLRALVRSEVDPPVRDRARLALAEIELAQHDVDGARALLSPLLDAADPGLAGDAAFLLARSMTAPRDRAAALARYLATPRPSPYREQAQLERAQALHEAGDIPGARAAARALRAEPHLPPIVHAGLERLERGLAAE